MPIDFPNSPSSGDSYSAGGKTWQYDGSVWVLRGVVASIPAGSIAASQLSASVLSSIDNLGDVNLTVLPTDGQFLKYSGSASAWVSGSVAPSGGLDTDSEGAISVMDIGA